MGLGFCVACFFFFVVGDLRQGGLCGIVDKEEYTVKIGVDMKRERETRQERAKTVNGFGADELQRAEDWQMRWVRVVLVTAALKERITKKGD